jgi:hypothetical protein
MPLSARATRSILASTVCLAASTWAHAQQARGVNPADIDSRFDAIAKRVHLDPEGSVDSLTLKYDLKLNANWALNFELPAYTRLSAPGLEASGNGDLFARARWIGPAGAWTWGASVETVLPAASNDALGTGRYQLNGAVLAVRALSSQFIAGAAVKQVTSLGGDGDRAKFSNTELRLVPVFIFDGGWPVTGELRHTWEHRSDLDWLRAEVVLNRQFTLQWAGGLGYSRDSGDRADRGTVSATVKYFF